MAIVGDIVHSRVARSDIHALTTLGAPEIRAVGPKTLVPGDLKEMGVRVCHDLAEGITRRRRDHHAAAAERAHERRACCRARGEFFKTFGLTPEKLALAKPDAIVMHPGPINRGVEIDSAVVDGAQSVILPQVTFGIAVRMAVMSHHRRQQRLSKRMSERILITNAPRWSTRRAAATRPARSRIAGGRIAIVARRRTAACATSTPTRTIDAARRGRRARAWSTSPRACGEPGHEHEGMLESELAAAVAGGVTSLVCPPDTDPVLDEPGLVEMLKFRAREA